MSDKDDKVTIREAKHEDYKGIMDISDDIYDGADYLPDSYHHYIHDPNAYCYVAEADGKIVGFTIAYLLDGGRQVVSVAERTAVAFRGKGIMNRMRHGQDGPICKLMAVNPQLRIRSFTTVSAEYYEGHIDDMPNISIIGKWHFRAYIIDGDKHKTGFSSLSAYQDIDIQVPSDDELTELLQNKRITAALFQGKGYLIGLMNWFPLTLDKENLLYVARRSIVMITKDKHTGLCCVMSYSTISKSPIGVRLCLYIRCTGVDPKTIVAHIMAHVIYASKHTLSGQSIILILNFPLEINASEVYNRLETTVGSHLEDWGDFGILVHERLRPGVHLLR